MYILDNVYNLRYNARRAHTNPEEPDEPEQEPEQEPEIISVWDNCGNEYKIPVDILKKYLV